MDHRSAAGRRKIDLARIGLGVGNKLGNRLGRNRWIDLHDKGPVANACDRRSVADEIEIQLVVKRDGDRVCRSESSPSPPARCHAPAKQQPQPTARNDAPTEKLLARPPVQVLQPLYRKEKNEKYN